MKHRNIGLGAPAPLALLAAVSLLVAGCTTDDASSPEPGSLRLYTSVTQETVDAVVDAYEQANPEVEVEVFRAPTGELTARLAAEEREGGIQADVLWLTDPLSMQEYAARGLLAEWEPAEEDAVPAPYRADSFWGTRLLNMVVVHAPEVTVTGWADLADPELAPAVAIPDPGFAGSALGALGFFALADDFGFDFYRALAEQGAVQVNSPGDVVTGVAEGSYLAGMTLDFSAQAALTKGSPIEVVWPEPGAIAIFSPIAVVADRPATATARSFVDFVLSRAAQELIAATGWQPIRDDVPWEAGGPAVTPDWVAIYDRQDELLTEYRSIFDG